MSLSVTGQSPLTASVRLGFTSPTAAASPPKGGRGGAVSETRRSRVERYSAGEGGGELLPLSTSTVSLLKPAIPLKKVMLGFSGNKPEDQESKQKSTPISSDIEPSQCQPPQLSKETIKGIRDYIIAASDTLFAKLEEFIIQPIKSKQPKKEVCDDYEILPTWDPEEFQVAGGYLKRGYLKRGALRFDRKDKTLPKDSDIPKLLEAFYQARPDDDDPRYTEEKFFIRTSEDRGSSGRGITRTIYSPSKLNKAMARLVKKQLPKKGKKTPTDTH